MVHLSLVILIHLQQMFSILRNCPDVLLMGLWACCSYKDSYTIVPVLVGSLTPEKEAMYGRIFSRYLADPQNLFVISSDFCHWGHRFRYIYYDRNWGEIYQSIQTLDRTVSSRENTFCGFNILHYA